MINVLNNKKVFSLSDSIAFNEKCYNAITNLRGKLNDNNTTGDKK